MSAPRPERSPDDPVDVLPGVGPARAAALERLGVRTLRDLLFVQPRRLERWPGNVPIGEARGLAGEVVRVLGRVAAVRRSRSAGRGGSVVRVRLTDDSGEIDALFFNQPWRFKQLVVGQRLELSGRVVDASGPAIAAPRIGSSERPLPDAGALEPEYPSGDGIAGTFLRELCRAALALCGDALEEPVDGELLAGLGLAPLPQALRALHDPPSAEAFEAARGRIAFERALDLQARLRERRAARDTKSDIAPPLAVDDETVRARLGALPFAPTGDQARAFAEVRADLARRVPMRRLLQGDVGSGKTVVGLWACAVAAAAGMQSAFLAPTELLAEQHREGLRALLAAWGLRADLLTGSLRAGERRDVLRRLSEGTIDILFGTHALFSSDVEYAALGVCIIDEQHRFGVAQRARLLEKGLAGGAERAGRDVHALLMTATPIPRTLALTVYGDLDVSILRERPPGRGTVRTRWLRGNDLRRLPAFVEERLVAGERVYWVCPRIGADPEDEEGADDGGPEASTARPVASAEARFAELSASRLARFGVELVHGRMPSDERSRRLERFRGGQVSLLVATTVIEAGGDVPEATVIVIEDAERLGTAQLHQLRGRVGRGTRDSWCLLRGARSAEERFRTLERTDDGFVLAEEDLKRRGMGDLAGLRQSGLNSEGLEALEERPELLVAARDWLARHPDEVTQRARRSAEVGATP